MGGRGGGPSPSLDPHLQTIPMRELNHFSLNMYSTMMLVHIEGGISTIRPVTVITNCIAAVYGMEGPFNAISLLHRKCPRDNGEC